MNTITPKDTFLQDSKRADNHMETVLDPQFRHACEVAMLQHAMSFTPGDQAAIYRLDGAKEVIKILLNLGEPNQTAAIKQFEGLKAI